MKTYRIAKVDRGNILVSLSEPLDGATFVWMTDTPFGRWAAFRSNEAGDIILDEYGIPECVSTIVGGDGGWTDVLSVDGYVDEHVAHILTDR